MNDIIVKFLNKYNGNLCFRKLFKKSYQLNHFSTMGLPLFIHGEVVKGFGRGSKELGVPTANFTSEVVNNLPEDVDNGIYYGWATINHGPVYKMVMSIGWNPYYKNTQKSVEAHIMHVFDEDFYGALLKVIVLGYIRPERSFSSLRELKDAIYEDIETAKKELDEPQSKIYKTHAYLTN